MDPAHTRGGWLPGLLALLLVACDPSASLFVERTWPADQTALLTITGGNLVPLEARPRLLPPEGATELSIALPSKIQIFVDTYAPGRIDRACAPAYDGDPLPPADASWTSGLVPSNSQTIVLHEGSVSSRPMLAGRSCVPRDLCSEVRVTIYQSPVEDDLRSLVLANDRAFVLGKSFELITVDPEGPRTLPSDPRLTGDSGGLVDDGRGGFIAKDEQKAFFALDGSGAVTATWTAPESIRGLFRGDGTILALTSTSPRRIVELTAGSTIAAPFSTPPADLSELAIVRRDLIAGWSKTDLYLFDGRRWDYQLQAIELDSVAGDEDELIALQSLRTTFLQRDGSWLEIPFAPVISPKATALGAGHFLVVGEAGRAAIWDGDRWCEIETEAGNFQRVEVSSDARVVWAISYREIVRFELPPRS